MQGQYADRWLTERLIAAGLENHAGDASLHLPGLILEVLSGTVDGVNRTFFSSRLPDTSRPVLVYFRRQMLQHGDGVTHLYSGNAFVLEQAPASTGSRLDLPPIALYFDSRLPVAVAAELPPPPRRRSLLMSDDRPAARRRFARAA